MTNRLLFDQKARKALQHGFDQIANIAQTTIGPRGGIVAVERVANRDKSPALLSDIATIARRIVALPDTFDNFGAMLARNLAWKVREQEGDGSATALILAQAMIAESVKYIAAGHNSMMLWRGMKKLQPHLDAKLAAMATILEEPEDVVSLAASIVEDEQLGELIEEIFDIIGPKGFIEVRSAYGMVHEREYVEGVYWDSGWYSPYFSDKDKENTAYLEKPHILITDHALETVQDLLPALNAVQQAENKTLVVIAPVLKEAALNLMTTNNARGNMRLLGLKAPRVGEMRAAILEDLSLLTGARFIRKDAGDSMANVKLKDLGHAQGITCSRNTFTIIGAMGNPHAIRERIHEAQQQMDSAEDDATRKNLSERVGKLLGGTALLYIGGRTESQRENTKRRAQDALQVVRAGLQGGVVAGGGSAYIALLPFLDEIELPEDEAPARGILRAALTAPTACLVRNAGFDTGPVLAQVKAAPEGWGFDVFRGEIVDMVANHIVDPLPTVRAALSHALSVATMAITTDVLVHRSYRDSEPSMTP